MTVRAGIIGAGRIAWAYDGGHWDGKTPAVTIASCLDRHESTRLVAIYDPVPEARAAFEHAYLGPRPVTLHSQLESFFAEDLELVAIASPSALHASHIEACLDANVPLIWIEKPVTLDIASFDALRARIAKMVMPPRICVNYFRRSLPQIAFMKRYLLDSPDAPEDIAIDLRYSRGLDVNGVHALDLLGALMNGCEIPPLDFVRYSDPANPQFGLTLEGIMVNVAGRSLPYHLIECEIIDSRGRLRLSQGGESLSWEVSEPNPVYPGFFRLGEPHPVVSLEDSKVAMKEATFRMLCSLLDTDKIPYSTLETAWFSQALLEAVQSAYKGGE